MKTIKTEILARRLLASGLAVALAISPALAQGDRDHDHGGDKAVEEHHDHRDGSESEEEHDAHGEDAHDGHGHDEEDGHDESGHGHSHDDEHDEHEDGHVTLTPAQIGNARLEIAEAGPGMLRPSLNLFGIVRPDLDRLVHVVPRFPGIVIGVNKRLGDRVERGDILATIESNESLRAYPLIASVSGRVILGNVVPGQFAGTDDPLMVVADLSTVWLDLQVHRHDAGLIREGQRVVFPSENGGGEVEAVISYVSPIAAQDTQSVLARATVANPEGHLQPGLFVTASVMQEPLAAPVTVKREAILHDGAAAFVYVLGEEGSFERAPVKTGRSDGVRIEILEGLDAGASYVAGNAFLLKAEAGKNAAAHSH